MNSTERANNSKKHAFDRACAEESTARALSQKSRSMPGYKTGTEKNCQEEEEEENSEGNCKQPATKLIGGSCGWENESVNWARSE